MAALQQYLESQNEKLVLSTRTAVGPLCEVLSSWAVEDQGHHQRVLASAPLDDPEVPSSSYAVPGTAAGSGRPVARRLRAAGRDAITLTLPGFASGDRRDGLRLSDATACVVRTVLDRDLTDITLVAHSWGGYPATAAAHQLTDRLSKVIFYSALVPARGVPLAEENATILPGSHDAMLSHPDDIAKAILNAQAKEAPGGCDSPGSGVFSHEAGLTCTNEVAPA